MAEAPAAVAPAPVPAPPLSVEQRIANALSAETVPAEPTPEPTPEPQEGAGDEAAREGPEPVDTGPTPAAEAGDGAASGESEAGGASADEGEGGGQESDVLEVGTLSELASAVGLDVEDLYQITVPIDVDGQRQEVSIGEWKDRVRAGIDSDAVAEARREAAEQRKASEAEIAGQRMQVQQTIAQAAALTEAAEKRLVADMESVNWADLRNNDPAEWSARQTELQQRQADIAEAKQKLSEAWTTQAETQKAEFTAQFTEHATRERDALLKAIPEWQDEGVFETERQSMRGYLSGAGFTEDEITSAVDHRVILLAQKAMKFDAAAAKSKVARKKVVKVGKKILRPGATAGKQAALEDRDTKLRVAHRKAGKIDTAADLIAARRTQR